MVNDQFKNLRGIYSALITPMRPDEEIDYDCLQSVVEFQINQGVEGFYCCGSSGEALLLSLEERKEIVETVINQVGEKVPVIVHVGTLRTKDTINLTLHAMEHGAKAVSMIPPYYYNFSQSEIVGYYEDILKATSAPIIIYNIPQFTGISFNKENAKSLFEHDYVIGIKHTSSDLYGLERMHQSYPEKIFFNGFDETFLSALAAGADSAVGTTVNLFFPRFKRIRALFNDGNLEKALVEQSIVNTCVEIMVKYGIFNSVKYAFSLLGLESGQCRRPFRPLTNEAKREIESIMEKFA